MVMHFDVKKRELVIAEVRNGVYCVRCKFLKIKHVLLKKLGGNERMKKLVSR